jgi:hypothetical protein
VSHFLFDLMPNATQIEFKSTSSALQELKEAIWDQGSKANIQYASQCTCVYSLDGSLQSMSFLYRSFPSCEKDPTIYIVGVLVGSLDPTSCSSQYWGCPVCWLYSMLVGTSILLSRPPKQIVSAAVLSQITEGTFLENKPLQLIYKGSKDGFSAINFHECTDNRGSAVVVCISGSNVFGGFNPNGWRSTDDYYSSTTAFLWAMSGSHVFKLRVLGGSAAVYDYATGGPCFGSGDLLIGPPKAAVMGGFAGPDMEDATLNAGDLRKGKSDLGVTYDADQRWPVRGSFRIQEVEVYTLKR